jgi:hypothetical protein
MTSDNPDLREIGFKIVEGPGVFVTTPVAARAYGCVDPFTCADCGQVLGEEEIMWMNLGEQPKPVWRHRRDCTAND